MNDDVSAGVEPGPAPAHDVGADLHTIGTATRLLASRVAELEDELARRTVTVDQLRVRLAEQMSDNQRAACARCEAELAELRSTRLFRWTQPSRDFYRRVRRLRDPKHFYHAVRHRLEARR